MKNAEHPVMKGVPATFLITDENYYAGFNPDAKVEVLAENAPDDTKPARQSVCITLGHAAEAHENPTCKSLLTNAVNWVSKR